MNGLLDGKICIVTGASRGIGKATAEKFAEEGAFVIGTARNEGSIEEWVAKEIKDTPGSIIASYFDITDTPELEKFVARVVKEYGHIDVLVNNAGIEINELVGMISMENMQAMFQTNVFATIEMMQCVSRAMAHSCCGSIINIASVVGVYGNAGQVAYSATKGAVIAATRSAAKELACKSIRVNAVAPGLTNTDMIMGTDPAMIENRIQNIKMGRLGEPSDVANACLFLASDLSSYISGQILGVDGCTVI